MAKLRIELDKIDVDATLDEAAQVVQNDVPHIKKGFKSVESDVINAFKGLYNWLADNEELQKDE